MLAKLAHCSHDAISAGKRGSGTGLLANSSHVVALLSRAFGEATRDANRCCELP